MKIEKIQFKDIRYNPERAAFEALVTLHDNGQTFTYPAHVNAPLNAEFPLISRGLVQAARRAHRAETGVVRSRRRARLPEVSPVIEDAKSLVQRLFGKLAA